MNHRQTGYACQSAIWRVRAATISLIRYLKFPNFKSMPQSLPGRIIIVRQSMTAMHQSLETSLKSRYHMPFNIYHFISITNSFNKTLSSICLFFKIFSYPIAFFIRADYIYNLSPILWSSETNIPLNILFSPLVIYFWLIWNGIPFQWPPFFAHRFH